MKLSDVKHKIDAYFNSVNPLDIVKQFEALGYVFEEADDHPFFDYNCNLLPISLKVNAYISENYSQVSDQITVQFDGNKQMMSTSTISITKFSTEGDFMPNNFQLNIAYAMAA